MARWFQAQLIARRNEAGSVAAEYGLLITLIALVMAGGAAILGGELDALLENVF